MTDKDYENHNLDTTQIRERKEFFNHIKKLAPEILNDLLKKVFPLSDEIKPEIDFFFDEDLFDLQLAWRANVYSDCLQGKKDLPPIEELSQFDRVFLSWANSYNLVDFWIIHSTLQTLVNWHGKDFTNADWSVIDVTSDSYNDVNNFINGNSADVELFELNLPLFNPDKETKVSYNKRFDEELSVIRNFRREQLKKKPSKKIHQPTKDERFEYLIKYCVLRNNWRRLRTNSQIGNLIKHLCDVIGFTRRNKSISEKINQRLSHKNP